MIKTEGVFGNSPKWGLASEVRQSWEMCPHILRSPGALSCPESRTCLPSCGSLQSSWAPLTTAPLAKSVVGEPRDGGWGVKGAAQGYRAMEMTVLIERTSKMGKHPSMFRAFKGCALVSQSFALFPGGHRGGAGGGQLGKEGQGG